MELNHWQPELGYGPRGWFSFDGGATTQAPSGSPDEFNAYAQFLLGLPSYMTKSLQYELQTGREWQYGLYVRDRWQVNKDLTVNLGLRWELYPMMTRENRGIEYYDNTNNTVLLGGLGGNPDTFGIKVKYPHFLPRIGISYRLGDNNVVRAGYGITVSPMNLSRPLRGFYPLTITNEFVGATDYLPAGTLETGIPLFYGPDTSSGVVDLPNNADMRSPYYDHLNRGYIQSWNLTYERRLPWDMSVSAGYVGTMTTHLMGFYNINAAGPGTGAGRPAALRGVRTPDLHRAVRRVAEQQLPLAADGPQQAVQQGVLREGGLHLLEGHEPPERRRVGERRLELPDADVQELRPGGLRPDPHLPARASWPICRSGRTARASATRSSRTGR